VGTLPQGAFSPHAGLFFLLPVLAHAGLPAFLEERPHLLDAGFPARFLDHMARRLGAVPDDPVRQALLAADGEIDGEAALLKDWRIAVRRWCRLRARIGLFDLICRPGLVIASRTHVDVFFDPRFVEMRVRRAGLDLDPGWVPWLGRVVLFHYEQPPEVLDVD
jgi:hypothetical protein